MSSIPVKFILPIFGLTFLAFQWVSGLPTQLDLLSIKQGLSQPRPGEPENAGGDPADEFLPFDKGWSNDGPMRLLVVPDSFRSTNSFYRYVGMGPIRVREKTRYRLLVENTKRYSCQISLSGTCYRDHEPNGFLLIGSEGLPASPLMFRSEFSFITPTGTDHMLFWIGTSSAQLYGPPKPIDTGVHGVFKTLSLLEEKKLATGEGKSILALSNLEFFSPGPFAPGAAQFVSGQNLSNRVQAEIGEGKVIRLHFRPGNYLYPHFPSVHFPEGKLENRLVRFTCRIRGKGIVKPGLWWDRKHIGYFYSHESFVALGPEWHPVVIEAGCVDPTVVRAAATLSCLRGEVEMEIARPELLIL
ncbi:MAG: hypothetical protein JNM63_03885 [Spirochaetia bacterium]|nr:hypothetical protein [Spirochaetia bacterium]